jgi:hypothetical protein
MAFLSTLPDHLVLRLTDRNAYRVVVEHFLDLTLVRPEAWLNEGPKKGRIVHVLLTWAAATCLQVSVGVVVGLKIAPETSLRLLRIPLNARGVRSRQP